MLILFTLKYLCTNKFGITLHNIHNITLVFIFGHNIVHEEVKPKMEDNYNIRDI